MAHKVHPKAFRVKEISDWNSRGFYNGKADISAKGHYKKPADYLEEDFKIREFLNKKLGKIGVEKIEIERFLGKLKIIISSARPGLIIGRGGGGIEELKEELKRKIFKNIKKIPELKLEIKEIRDPWFSARLTAQWMAQRLEKRIPYRRVLKQALDKIMTHKEIQGARVEVAGRLNGAEIARRAWLSKGRLPRQSLRADIDYAQARAYCSYGVVGVKIWIYKGEKF